MVVYVKGDIIMFIMYFCPVIHLPLGYISMFLSSFMFSVFKYKVSMTMKFRIHKLQTN